MSDKTDPRLDVLLPIFRAPWGRGRPSFTATVLNSLDAADRAAGIVRVDTNDEALVERITSVLADNGVQPNTEAMHSWRCNEPDRYPNYCTCVPELVGDLIAALREES